MRPLCISFGLNLALWLGPAFAISPGELRAAIARSMNVEALTQEVTFGPMTDGRTLSFTIIFDATMDGTGIVSRNDTHTIHFDRYDVGRAAMVIDGMLGCAQHIELCPLMAEFIEQVYAVATIADARLLDEFWPAAAPQMAAMREDQELYAASLSSGIESLILAVDLHEIGHAVMGHQGGLELTAALRQRQEAQADGFAVTVMGLADYPPAGFAAMLMDVIVDQDIRGQVPNTHPAGVCRASVFAKANVDWVERNRLSILQQRGNDAGDKLARRLLEQVLEAADPILTAMGNVRNCTGYLEGFAEGVEAATRLVTTETPIVVSPDPFTSP